MKRKTILILVLALLLAALLATTALAATSVDKKLLQQVRQANHDYRKVEAAMDAGYMLLPGVDHCFYNPGVGGMGYHYINPGLLDTALDPLTPEAMVYHTSDDGRLKLGAVEYVVPAAAWEAEGHEQPPEVLGQTLHLNPPGELYILHVWMWKPNPDGVFADWNPLVSCP